MFFQVGLKFLDNGIETMHIPTNIFTYSKDIFSLKSFKKKNLYPIIILKLVRHYCWNSSH